MQQLIAPYQYYVLLLIGSLSSSLSLLGSITIILASKRHYLRSIYQQLIFMVSITDVFVSLSYLFHPFMMPKYARRYGLLFSSGNASTCNVAGFVLEAFSIMVIFYGYYMSLYFYWKVKYNIADRTIRTKRYQLMGHIMAIIISFSIPSYAWITLQYRPTPYWNICTWTKCEFFGQDGIGTCQSSPTYEATNSIIAYCIYVVPLSLFPLTIINMFRVYWTVRCTIKKYQTKWNHHQRQNRHHHSSDHQRHANDNQHHHCNDNHNNDRAKKSTPNDTKPQNTTNPLYTTNDRDSSENVKDKTNSTATTHELDNEIFIINSYNRNHHHRDKDELDPDSHITTKNNNDDDNRNNNNDSISSTNNNNNNDNVLPSGIEASDNHDKNDNRRQQLRQRLFMSTRKQQNQQQEEHNMKKVIMVRNQALLYAAAYINSILWIFVVLGLSDSVRHMIAQQIQQQQTQYNTGMFVLLCVAYMLAPLQGLCNAIVYARPRYLEFRQLYPQKGRWYAIKQAIALQTASSSTNNDYYDHTPTRNYNRSSSWYSISAMVMMYSSNRNIQPVATTTPTSSNEISKYSNNSGISCLYERNEESPPDDNNNSTKKKIHNINTENDIENENKYNKNDNNEKNDENLSNNLKNEKMEMNNDDDKINIESVKYNVYEDGFDDKEEEIVFCYDFGDEDDGSWHDHNRTQQLPK